MAVIIGDVVVVVSLYGIFAVWGGTGVMTIFTFTQSFYEFHTIYEFASKYGACIVAWLESVFWSFEEEERNKAKFCEGGKVALYFCEGCKVGLVGLCWRFKRAEKWVYE